ncbi:CHAT domain-containing protein [Neolewinella lacunae]|uniref:CHAT domain-containing protein n=1 Tax=Neolewinella lacunae TaxID=1517758 RepID=A0A923PL92_9BACT|nr:CHAT domain-containing protein [Neolewinella lacunae]MBC6996137.1 CHAT domain-containing protein [Neolewinella lacunae]MDN3633990.1 CHAT domain-containing protein [Neolewinella lacunae]
MNTILSSKHPEEPRNYEYYFKRNKFADGATYFFASVSPELEEFTPAEARRLIAGFRLKLLIEVPWDVEKALLPYAARIREAGPIESFEIDLIEARIAYQRGFYLRAYNLVSILIAEVETFQAEGEDQFERVEASFLLPRAHIVAGKTLYRGLDHALARVHLGLAFDLIQYSSAPHAEKKRHDYLRGRICVLVARSYFDYPLEHGNISGLFASAESIYADSLDPNHIYWSEIDDLKALFDMTSYHPPYPGWFLNAEERLVNAGARIQQAFNGKDHRRMAHLKLLAGVSWLNRGRELRAQEHGEFTPAVMEAFGKAAKHFREEYQIRKGCFEGRPHPTQAKCLYYLSHTELLAAQCKIKQGNIPEAQQHLREAEELIKEAHEANRRSPKERKENQRIAKRPGVPFAADSLGKVNCLDRLQYFKISGKELKLQYLRYQIAASTKARTASFRQVLKIYRKCYAGMIDCIIHLNSEASRESIFERFTPMQENAIAVCQKEFDLFPTGSKKQREIFDIMLNIHLQGKRNMDWKKKHAAAPVRPGKLALEGFRGRLNILQLYIQKMLVASGQPQEDRNLVPLEDFRGKCERTIKENFDRIEDSWDFWQKERHLSDQEDGFKADTIISRFDGNKRTGLISFFAGQEHLYLLSLFQTAPNASAYMYRAVRLTGQGQSFTGVKGLQTKAEHLAKTISCVHRVLKREQKNGQMGNGEDQHQDGPSAFANRLINGNALVYYPPEEHFVKRVLKEEVWTTSPAKEPVATADRLNSLWLTLAYEMNRDLFGTLENIPRSLYLTFNQEWMQRIPYSLMPLRDPASVASAGKEYRFSKLPYFGTKYEHALLPCLADIWRVGGKNGSHTSASTDPDNPPNLYLFLAAHGIDYQGDQHHAPKEFISTLGPKHFTHLKQFVFDGRINQPLHRFQYFPAVTATGRYTPEDKELILARAQLSAVLYFFCHVEQEKDLSKVRKLIKLTSPPPGEESDFAPEYLRSPTNIYHEEIAESDFRNNWLVFISGCGSAEGFARVGYMAFSMMTAFLDAGSRSVIGTQFTSYTQQAKHYSEIFFQQWVGITDKRAKALGIAMRRANKIMLKSKNEGYTHYSNPLHWGAYLLLGDMSLRFAELEHFGYELAPKPS